MGDFYVTSFCNFAHRLKDGKPIEHECYIIPPRLLKLEMKAECCTEGECGEAWREWCNGPRESMRRGVKE
jgi:hypothetical protein